MKAIIAAAAALLIVAGVTFFIKPPASNGGAKGIGDELVLSVPSVKTVDRKLKDDDGHLIEGRKLTLFLDHRPMALEPTVKDYQKNQLRFRLKRTPENAFQWEDLYNSPTSEGLTIGVSSADDPTNVIGDIGGQVMHLRLADPLWWRFSVFLVAVTGVALAILGGTTALLRGSAGRKSGQLSDRPYSLGLVQMAWWFFIILASYLFLWVVLREKDSLNSTALVLLGISVTTAVAGKSIDTFSRLNKEPVPDGKITTAKRASRNRWTFWSDILSDDEGISLYRLQMVVWTLVLTAVFVVEIWGTKQMPVFSDKLLFLMGISSGTYIGFKIPENRSTADTVADPG